MQTKHVMWTKNPRLVVNRHETYPRGKSLSLRLQKQILQILKACLPTHLTKLLSIKLCRSAHKYSNWKMRASVYLFLVSPYLNKMTGLFKSSSVVTLSPSLQANKNILYLVISMYQGDTSAHLLITARTLIHQTFGQPLAISSRHV